MNSNIKELVSYFDTLFKKNSWHSYSNDEWYTFIDINDGIITNLKKSEDDLMVFLKRKSLQILNKVGSNIDKEDKLRLNKLIENNFKDVVVLIDNDSVELELYQTYTKKEEKKYTDKNFNEIYEGERKMRQMNNMEHTVHVLERILSKKIDFDDNEVWDSLRNGVERYSEQVEKHPFEWVKQLLEDLSKNITSAKNIVLTLCKDASRQNLSEEMQKIVWGESGINLRGLPQSGDDTIHIFDGKWVKGVELSKDTKGIATKAMDFKVIDSNSEVYTYNKYNKWVGGSTDDVYNDIKKTIESFKKITNNTIKLLIILDGEYWDLKRKELTKYNNEMLMITCSDESYSDNVKGFVF